MDKISSILPGNARIHTVDMDESRSARPGAPSFGRTVGKTASDRDKITISAAARDNLMREIDAIVSTPKESLQAEKEIAQNIPKGPAVNESLAELSGATLDKYA
jgi:hypothetical protein